MASTAQLLDHIAELEAELAERDEVIEQLMRDLDAAKGTEHDERDERDGDNRRSCGDHDEARLRGRGRAGRHGRR